MFGKIGSRLRRGVQRFAACERRLSSVHSLPEGTMPADGASGSALTESTCRSRAESTSSCVRAVAVNEHNHVRGHTGAVLVMLAH